MLVEGWRHWRGAHVDWRSTVVWAIVLPAVAAVLALAVKPTAAWAQTLLALLLIVPMGPLLYRLVFRPLAHASVLMLLNPALGIVAAIIHDVDLDEARPARPESPGIGALINGITLRTDQCRERLEQGLRVFDDLLEYFRRTVRRQPGQNQPS